MTDAFDPQDALAADYVLGTLDAGQRRRVEAMIEADPSFASRVALWSARLTPLAETVASVEPPAAIWQNIEAAIIEAPAASSVYATPIPLLQRLSFWRWSAISAGAVAVALALYIAAAPLFLPVREDRYVAVLNEGGANASWLVTVDLISQQLTIRPLNTLPQQDRTLELWLVSGGGTPPRSLGLLDRRGETLLPISAVLRDDMPTAAALAVSLEPAGGSPTGQPTGPVVYQGALLSLNK